MFTVTPSVIDEAFHAFARVYVRRPKPWNMDHHVTLWMDACAAMVDSDPRGFEDIYDHLRSHWQIARGKKDSLASADKVCEALSKVPPRLRNLRPSAITESDVPELARVVETVGAVKVLQGGPSIMVGSKLLHFMNPRLFVIVDRAMMWNGAFSRSWVWNPVAALRTRLAAAMSKAPKAWDDEACDPYTYAAVLLALSGLLRRNPGITDGLVRFLQHECKDVTPPVTVREYEAAAVEWFLLGVVELLPCGVSQV